MAARENQGYLIAVIILVLLSLVLALVAFLGWSTANQNFDQLTKLEQRQEYNEAYAKLVDNQSNALLAMIGNEGFSADQIDQFVTNMDQATTQQGIESEDRQQLSEKVSKFKNTVTGYRNDVSATASVVDGETVKSATYRERIQNLTAVIAKKVKDVNVQIRQAEDAELTASAAIEQKDEQLKIAKDETEKMRTELESVKQAALVNETRLKNELKDANSELAVRTTQLEEETDKFAKIERNLKEDIGNWEKQVASLKQTIARFTRDSYDVADGRIVNVAGSLNTVFINLGARDGLRVNRTFSVYEKGTTNFRDSEPKGSIEVIRVGVDRAEASITTEDQRKPILSGDLILTPTWDPGVAIRYALIGRFDLDGDNFDDTETLIREIERNGGKVVARHDEEGNPIGEIDPSVDFIVEGNAEIIDDGGNLITTMQQMRRDADKNTVSAMALDKLLKKMGVASRLKTTKFDVPAGGFNARYKDSLKDEDR
ncbi:MAG: hypothetical protein AAFN77_06595 [Planctomycetota bacterium]